MTLEAFYKLLAETPYTWQLVPNLGTGSRLRAFLKPAGDEVRSCCPLTAVYYHQSGHFVTTYDTDHAARGLELPRELAQLVVHAADHSPLPGHKSMCLELDRIRAELVKATSPELWTPKKGGRS